VLAPPGKLLHVTRRSGAPKLYWVKSDFYNELHVGKHMFVDHLPVRYAEDMLQALAADQSEDICCDLHLAGSTASGLDVELEGGRESLELASVRITIAAAPEEFSDCTSRTTIVAEHERLAHISRLSRLSSTSPADAEENQRVRSCILASGAFSPKLLPKVSARCQVPLGCHAGALSRRWIHQSRRRICQSPVLLLHGVHGLDQVVGAAADVTYLES